MSEVKVNKISPRSGTAITLGDSGDTFTIPSGATLAIAGTVTGFTSAGIDDNATSVAITIDSNEDVGIGTTSPSEKLEVRDGKLLVKTTSGAATIEIVSPGGTSDSVLNFGDSADNNVGAIAYEHDNNAFRFLANVAERMRLDSSGRLLVGKTAIGDDTVGVEIRGDGLGQFTRSGNKVLMLNRKSSVGAIQEFRKDNTEVGSIGVESAGFYIDGEALHTGLIFTSNSVSPRDNGSATNNATDLGNSVGTWKDLYLGGNAIIGGGIKLGGTGTANTLDDYETGTWTPVMAASGTNPSVGYAVQEGRYTKIGRQVIAPFRIQLNALTLGSASGNIQIQGLPFTSASTSSSNFPGSVYYVSNVNFNLSSFGTITVGIATNPNSAAGGLARTKNSGGADGLPIATLASNTDVSAVFIYEV